MNFLKGAQLLSSRCQKSSIFFYNQIMIANRPFSICAPSTLELDRKTLDNTQQIRYKRFPTVKRRTTHPMRWWQKQNEDPELKNEIIEENIEILKSLQSSNFDSPLKMDAPKPGQWTPESHRTGVIARKLGCFPLWQKNGKRVITTLLQVSDNHVINCFDVAETKKNIIFQKRWQSSGFATITVGAESDDYINYTEEYSNLFKKAGVLPKKKLAKFIISEDAMLPPGTPLTADHFQVGQFVDVFGKTIDRGFEGVVSRWGFKGDGRKHHGATKAHRRPGSISQGRKAGGPMKGKRMAGHWGNERVTMNGLQILRINHELGIVYVSGCSVPGSIGNWVYIFDSKIEGKGFKSENPPPFPTYIDEGKEKPEEEFLPIIHKMDDETIIFEETEEEKKAAQRRTGAKLAKVRRK